ncbi:hypothetical protein BJX68DRAFT_167459 [Aspergillus pseudodeflectus]|uniref:Uncharacterized protein n=1 Tax=Aspergillus pseudodeflectus TaxID=176178 RepID=A0ABR4JR31_9EURO
MTRLESMAVSVTCHRQLSSGGYEYGSHAGNNHNSSSHPLHLAASTLAASPLSSTMEHAPSSSLAVPSLDLPSEAAVDNSHSCHSFDLAGGVYILSATSDGTGTATSFAKGGMVETFTASSDKLRTPKRKRTASPPSTKSPGETRPTSRSVRRSPGNSRQSSLHSHRRTGTTASLTSVPDTPVRRENLLALHRESCRLFQDSGNTTNHRRSHSPPGTPPRPPRTYSDISTPPVTPILERPYSTFYPSLSSSPNNSNVPAEHIEITTSTQPEPTIIEWTSPSTRRREYEEIDRATSGIRGLWRRIAPRWCQFGNNSRVPFFEEGKNGKANYEGSVRRFRMDLPDDEPVQTQNQRSLKLKPKLVVHAIGGRRSKTTSWL